MCQFVHLFSRFAAMALHWILFCRTIRGTHACSVLLSSLYFLFVVDYLEFNRIDVVCLLVAGFLAGFFILSWKTIISLSLSNVSISSLSIFPFLIFSTNWYSWLLSSIFSSSSFILSIWLYCSSAATASSSRVLYWFVVICICICWLCWLCVSFASALRTSNYNYGYASSELSILSIDHLDKSVVFVTILLSIYRVARNSIGVSSVFFIYLHFLQFVCRRAQDLFRVRPLPHWKVQ